MILDEYLISDEQVYESIKETISLEEDSNLSIYKIKNGFKLKSDSCRGLTSEDILVLKLFYDNGLIDKNLFMKISMPFAPSICIAYIITIFYGNLIFLLF